MIPLTRTLARKRQALVARSREQRADVFYAAQPTVRGLALVDRVADFARARPVVITLGVAALLAFGPRKLITWGLRIAPLAALLRRL